MSITSCCFTGHRQVPLSELSPLTAQLDSVIATLYGEGCRLFYAGGAMGFDTLAASRVLLFRATHEDAELHLLLPCRNQTKNWSVADAARFEEILAASNGFCYLRDDYSAEAMAIRNQALVDAADVCVAYLRRTTSGSGQTVRAAQKKGIPVINLANRFPADNPF